MSICETCRYCSHLEKKCMASNCTPRYTVEDGCPLYAMSARAFMERVISAQRRIVSMEEHAARYRDMAMRATGNLQAIRTSGTPARSKVEDGVCAFADICADIEREAEKLRGIISETRTVIDRLTDSVQREVLELRYLNGLRWEDIARRMRYDDRSVRRIHLKALENVQREMDLLEFARHRPGWNPGGVTAVQHAVLQ